MTHEQITLVRQSFSRIQSDTDMIATRFYSKLFLLDPSLHYLFPADITEQGRKLVAMLAFVVQELKNPGALLLHVEKLGERHSLYGVRDEHYATVGTALLWTLEKELGADFTDDVRKAWAAAYTLLSQTMIQAGRTGR
jgi:hemoglobin-like flavoprotein